MFKEWNELKNNFSVINSLVYVHVVWVFPNDSANELCLSDSFFKKGLF